MSSRQEEKQKRRAEREALEAAAAAKAARKTRLQLGLGALMTVAAIAAAVIVFSGGKDTEFDGSPTKADSASAVKLPPIAEADLGKALKAAGCVQKSPPIEGSSHTSDPVTYKNSNPPASGDHYPEAPQDGAYEAGSEPTANYWVHSLEHGRIVFQYRPGSPKAVIDQVEAIAGEELQGVPGYKTLAVQNNTKMKAEVAASAWGQVVTCEKMTPGVVDAFRAFRKEYTDKGPELIP